MSPTAPARRPATKTAETKTAETQAASDESRTLEQSFAAFTRISRSLEEAYDRLREQAARVDLELAQSNRSLNEKVAELDATSRHLDAVVKSLAGAVVVTDPAGRITLVNRAFEELVGEPAAALVGRSKADLVDADGRPICPSCDASGGAVAESRPLSLRGGRRIVRSSRAPVVGADGAALGEVEALADETELEALREELRRRETLIALGEMAAGIAHELRNPLNAVEGFAHLLVKALDAGADAPKDPRLHALRIVAGVRKANAIITNLLCFARPSRFAPRRERVDRLLLELRHSLCEEGGERARVEIRPAQPKDLEVAGDLALLERMLVNLIENGRTAAGAGGRVAVCARRVGGEVALSVEDDGPGIPPELRDRLFRPFVTGRSDGIGLGLFLVHRIVELHRGRIDVAPRAGGGTVFTVRLPGTRDRERAQPLPACAETEGATR
jgi:two-component system sensor histidine kinase HydH